MRLLFVAIVLFCMGRTSISAQEDWKKRYDEVAEIYPQMLEDTFVLATKNDKYALVSFGGIELLPPVFDRIVWFPNDKKILTQQNGLYGIHNYQGEVICPHEYEWISSFYWGKDMSYDAIQMKKNGKFGLLSQTGDRVILQPLYEQFAPVKGALKQQHYFNHYGWIALVKEDKFGLVNTKGEEIVAFKYDSIGAFPFESPLATHKNSKPKGLAAIKREGKWGYMNGDFEEIVPCDYDWVTVRPDAPKLVRLDGKMGLLNSEGKEQVPIMFDDILNVNDDLFLATINGSWGLIDAQATVLYPFVLDTFSVHTYAYHQNGTTSDVLLVEQNGRYGVINGYGEEVVPVRYDSLVIRGKTVFVRDANQWEAKRFTGEDLLAYSLDLIEPINTKYFEGTRFKKGNYYGLISNEAMLYFEPIYDSLVIWENSYYIDYVLVYVNGKCGLFSATMGELIERLPIAYKEITLHNWTNSYRNKEHYLQLNKNGKYSFWNSKTETILLPFEYNKIVQYYQRNNHVALELGIGQRYGLFDIKEKKIILPVQYDTLQRGYRFKEILQIKKGKKWGLFSLPLGEILLEPEYDTLYRGRYGKLVIAKKGEKYGLFYPFYQMPPECVYDTIYAHSSSGDYFVRKGDLMGLVNEKGEFKIACIYQKIERKESAFYIAKKEGAMGLINSRHDFIDLSIYEEAKLFETYILVRNGTLWGLLDEGGKQLFDLKYQDLKPFMSGDSLCFVVQQKRKYTAMSLDEKLFLERGYTNLEPLLDNKSKLLGLRAKKGRKFGLIDLNNSLIIPFNYSGVRVVKGNQLECIGKKGKVDYYNKQGQLLSPSTK